MDVNDQVRQQYMAWGRACPVDPSLIPQLDQTQWITLNLAVADFQALFCPKKPCSPRTSCYCFDAPGDATYFAMKTGANWFIVTVPSCECTCKPIDAKPGLPPL